MANIMGKFRNMLKQSEEEEMEYDDYYTDDEEETTESESEPAPDEEGAGEEPSEGASAEVSDDTGSNVINIHDSAKVQFVLFKPETFDKDITTMADEFIKRNTVILNMEQTNKDVAKRIIDFLGGVAYAHNGKISKVAEDTYIVMPSHVELSGDDLMDEVESDSIYF